MLAFATDWYTLSAAATALGTLVLAVATFAAVRSSNASARVAEQALQEQRRPVLTHSRMTDPPQKMMYGDRHWVKVEGGRAAAEHVDGVVYLAISLRNVGQGMAVCQCWTPAHALNLGDNPSHAPIDQMRTQTRDLYIPAGDIGMWQGALRDPNDPVRAMLAASIDALEPISIEVLYSDLVGGQRTITRFSLFPTTDPDGTDVWFASMARHWHLDHLGPRVEADVSAAVAEIARHVRAAQPAADLEDDAVS